MQACADNLGRLAERFDAEGDRDAARRAELMEAVGRIPAAVAGSLKNVDGTGPEQLAGIRADLALLTDALGQIAGILDTHNRRQLTMVEALEALGTTVASLQDRTHDSEVLQAHLGQTQVLGDLVRNTTSLAARFVHFEAVLARHNPGFWALVSIALLFGFGAGLMTDFMVKSIDGSAGMSVPLVTELLSWLSLGAGPEAAAPE